jgi:hypothetical protein
MCQIPTPTSQDLQSSGDVFYGGQGGQGSQSASFINWALTTLGFFRQHDWDYGYGWGASGDLRLPLARTLAAVWCLHWSAAVPERDEGGNLDILHWGRRYFRTWIAGLRAGCHGPKNAVAQTPRGVRGPTDLFLRFFYDRSVPERAGTLLHEARHAGGVAHDGAHGKDVSWNSNGAWRWHVCWLAWYAKHGVRTSKPLQDLARTQANIILGSKFETKPGFSVA